MKKGDTNDNRRSKTPSITSLIRRSEYYEEWKRAVFIRDRFACQHCGKRNGRRRVIEAHHVKELSALIKEAGIKTIEQALETTSLWDVNNGLTLCRSCHEKTPSYPKQLIGRSRPKIHSRYAYTKRT